TSITRMPSRGPGKTPSFVGPYLRQAVELGGVVAGYFAQDGGGQVAELLVDILGRIGPDAVRMRVVRAPHQGLDADVVDQLGPDAVVLERGLALAAPVFAGPHLESEVTEAILPLEIHAVEGVGQPANATLAQRD